MFEISAIDIVAIVIFVASWFLYSVILTRLAGSGRTLSSAMDIQRRQWMRTMMHRDLRMIDTGIMSGLQNGTAFFASSSMIALGGSFTLLNQTDRMMEIFSDLPFHVAVSRGVLETKIVGLVAIYGYAFFKFGWAYRLFNYSAILIGSIPLARDADTAESWGAARRAAEMQIDAGHHFHWGLRALFFSIGFFGWFVNATVFILSTTIVLLVLSRRQYLSRARAALIASDGVVGTSQGDGNSADERPSSR